MGSNNKYKTKDLGEAAALVCCTVKLTNLQRDGSVVWFEFENKIKCKQISKDYFYNELMVNALKYYEISKRLKSRIFSI